jgi:hypothetical protein
MMTSRLCVAFSVLASIAGQEAKADPQQDPKSVDILGFHIGMLAGEAATVAKKNIENAVLTPRAGTFTQGTFTTPELLFSDEITHSYDFNRGRTTAEMEKVTLIFGQQPGAGILGILRTTPYDKETAPTIKDVIDSLEAKYGKPTNVEKDYPGGANEYRVVYAYGASIPYNKSPPGAGVANCTFGMPDFSGSLPFVLATGAMTNNVPDYLPKCGTLMIFEMRQLPENPELVGFMTSQIADLKGFVDNNRYLLDLLKTGQQSAVDADRIKAAANKPKL